MIEAPLAIVACTRFGAAELERVISLHRDVYSREQGVDADFEAHVRESVDEFLGAESSAGSCLWLVEREGELVGTVAMLRRTPEEAQLRWFLVDPRYRGAGLGTALLTGALRFARENGYRSVFLWTVSKLEAASALYTRMGFVRTAAGRKRLWGGEVTEERYELALHEEPVQASRPTEHR